MAFRFLVKASQYADSVTLMSIARSLREMPGIEEAALVMGTDANKRLLAEAGMFIPEMGTVGSNDLIVAVRGEEALLNVAMEKAHSLLTASTSASEGLMAHHPRTVRTACRAIPNANLAVISVAGRYAAAEAWAALCQGLHVLLFSDHVSLEDEISLKQYAVENDLLMMGPGAGTAILNGVALGFANVVPRGPVGIVSAAGTGLQEVSTLLAKHGIGLSQGIGVGGRDLSAEVGGRMMHRAIEALQEDPATEVIVAVSKLPSPPVVEEVLAKLEKGAKPAVVIFLGQGHPRPEIAHRVMAGEMYVAGSLLEAALAAAAMVEGEDLRTVRASLLQEQHELRERARGLKSQVGSEQKYLRGLFSGGTLCEEAMQIWHERVGGVWSNAPLDPEYLLPDVTKSREHTVLDLGDEVFTVGRPHPMIDTELRVRRLLQEARDPSVAVIQMDVVLGYGAHPDPAGDLAPAIEEATRIAAQDGRALIHVISITGTKDDPQGLERQREKLERAGANVLEGNARASWLASMVVSA